MRDTDVVLLDLGLPDIDGRDVFRELPARSKVPVIMLTARGDEFDRVLGLELGADDYVTKPFSVRELSPASGPSRAAPSGNGAVRAGPQTDRAAGLSTGAPARVPSTARRSR